MNINFELDYIKIKSKYEFNDDSRMKLSQNI